MSGRSHIMPTTTGAVIALLVGVSSSLAHAASKEPEALELAKKAIYSDYLEMRFPDAEKKLREAIALCEPNGACTGKVRAQLRCDLGILYVGGMSRLDDGKAEFREALKKDKSAAIAPDLVSPEIEAAFNEVKEEAPAAPPPSDAAPAGAGTDVGAAPPSDGETAPAAPIHADANECPPDFPGCHSANEPPPCEAGADCAAPPPPKSVKNWFSLSVQQDVLALGSDKAACAGAADSKYICFETTGSPPAYYSAIPYDKSGDELKGGLKLATTRILLGYDRAIGSFSLGVRVGFAFGGGPQIQPDGAPFFPWHAEGRVAYWFGRTPFARTGPRPYLVVAGGGAQVDAKVPVVVYDSRQDFGADKRHTVNAWLKSGTAFVGGGVGMLYAITVHTGPVAEVKFTEMLGKSAPSLNFQLGYAVGF